MQRNGIDADPDRPYQLWPEGLGEQDGGPFLRRAVAIATDTWPDDQWHGGDREAAIDRPTHGIDETGEEAFRARALMLKARDFLG